MALPRLDKITEQSTEFDLQVKGAARTPRGPGSGPRAPAGFKKAVEEIANIIFSKTRISVEGAAKAVIPSIPKMLADITNDIRTGSVDKFKLSLEKLEKITEDLGLDLRKYNKGLADFLKKREDNMIQSENRIGAIRESGAKAQIDQITGKIDFLSKEEIKTKTETLRTVLKELEVDKKSFKSDEKKLTKKNLSEEEVKTKKKDLSETQVRIEKKEEEKSKLMETLNIRSEEELPATSFFGRFRRKPKQDDMGGGGFGGGDGEGIRGYVPNFIMDIADSFKDQIGMFLEPFITIKNVIFDILKPLKIFKKLLGPIVLAMGRFLKAILRQIIVSLALVAANMLRLLTDKKVLIGMIALAGIFGAKKLWDKFTDDDKKKKEKPVDLKPHEEGYEEQEKGDVWDPKAGKYRPRPNEVGLSSRYDYTSNKSLSKDERVTSTKMIRTRGGANTNFQNLTTSNVSNSQVKSDNSMVSMSAPSVNNTGNKWYGRKSARNR